MSLRIAFDLDGTLADLDAALDALAERLFPSSGADRPGRPVPPEEARQAEDDEITPEEEQLEPPEVRALSRRQQRDIWAEVRSTIDFWETLDETEPGVVARLAEVAEERRWEVIFVTQRPACDGDTTQRQSQRWLQKHGFTLPSVYVLGGDASRGKVAAALGLDVVVDDRAENCLDVKVGSPARCFLVNRRASATVAANAARLGIEVVPSVNSCLDQLAATPVRNGLMGRLRRMLGSVQQD